MSPGRRPVLLELAGRLSFAAALIAASAAPALAQSIDELGTYRDWAAYKATTPDGELCFAMTKPKDISPIPPGYTQAYLYLTNRPDDDISNEFNLLAGFTFQTNSQAMLSVGDQSFSLFTQDDAAWLADPAQGDILVDAVRAGSRLTVTGTSQRGETITESFSLLGATAATSAAEGAC